MAQVTVSIDGKQYRMACDEGQEEHLIDLAERFDRYVSHLKDSFGEIGDQRLTVMAAITLADRFSESESRIGMLESEVATLERARAAAAKDADKREAGLAESLESVAERLETLADRLNGSDPLETH